ncbi:methyl-accepting chemotaxis protein [Pseudooceanicola sp. 502str34]
MKIEEKIRPWGAAERATGEQVRRAIGGQLREVLLKAYRVVDPGLQTLPDTLWRNEQAKFDHISTGDFSPAYFELQRGLARNIAGQVDFPTYLMGYAHYAGNLMCALSRAEGRGALSDSLIQSLMTSIFCDVAVAMHHFFEVEAEEDRRGTEVLGGALQALARGDLTHRIGEEAPKKIARAREDFNSATDTLHTTLSEIVSASAEVQGAAEHIAAAVDAMSRRTEQQAAALGHSGSELEGVSTMLTQTSESGRTAAAAASEARAMVTGSAEQMGETRATMAEIATSSREIRQIVSVIDTIAMQTNLLALNAGVEAARAGEAGRGFAVVATEVRSLAQRSAEAAKNIRTLMDASAAQVDRGEALVNRTSEDLSVTRDKVLEIDHLLGEIARMADQQAQGVRRVNKGVSDTGNLTQQNAAMGEETSAEAATLRDNVLRLNALIGQFTLTRQAETGRGRPRAAVG